MSKLKLILVTNKYSGFVFKPTDTVVLIDIYRATSTIVTALANGAIEIIPFVEIEQVLNFKNKNSEIIGVGERNGENILGIEFDNSPVLLNTSTISGKVIALSTTNCTKAIDIVRFCEDIIFSAYLNLSSTVNHIVEQSSNFNRLVIFCAGNKDEESEEDNMFASELIARLDIRLDLELDNTTKEIMQRREKVKDIDSYLRNTKHSRRLISLGKRNDIDFSLKFDKFDCVPYYANGSIKKNNFEGKNGNL